jgi:hypothetical protein
MHFVDDKQCTNNISKILFSTFFIQSKLLHNLHSRRKEILAKIQSIPTGIEGAVSNPLLKGCTASPPSVREILKDPYKASSDKVVVSTKSTLTKAVSDTLNTNQITSLTEVPHRSSE